MITLSNGLSLARAPLACLFFQQSPTLRLLGVLLAMFTDSIDGYLARRNRSVSQLGTILDPLMDKLFVYTALAVLFWEGKLVFWQVLAFLSRDFFVFLYGLLMILMGRVKTIVFRAIRWGKVTTALQFLVLAGLIYDVHVPWYVCSAFGVMGVLAFRELIQTDHHFLKKRSL